MGYIPATACNFTIEVYLTELGREYLVKKDTTRSTVKYFTLGDSDANYLIAKKDNSEGYRNIPELDFLPGLSGTLNPCFNATRVRSVKHRLTYTSDTTQENTVFLNTKARIKTCGQIIDNPIDCSTYSSEIALDSEVLADTIWECLVENFDGTL
jgi:hypothetical protein